MTDLAHKIFSKLAAKNPQPTTELHYTNAYTCLVAVILSAQATDIMVNRATANLFKVIDTPKKMLDLGLDKLKDYIKIIGLYNSKAKNIMAMSMQLIEQHQSQIPDNRTELMALPGVGRKTANVVLQLIFGQDTIAVDTHVHRVSQRLGLSNSANVLLTEQQLLANIPKKWLANAHHWLILHGRYICTARKPNCQKCELNQYCQYYVTTNK